MSKAGVSHRRSRNASTSFALLRRGRQRGAATMSLGGDIIGTEQCKKLQSFIMSMETAKDFGELFELTTAR